MSEATPGFPERLWYGSGLAVKLWVLTVSPLTAAFALLAMLRRSAFRLRILRQYRFSVPVVVVGNITVGGTGKTPMVIALVKRLRKAGWKPGVVSRGYGGDSAEYPLLVTAGTPVSQSGDEPALIARRTLCPVAVDPRRGRAVRFLTDHYDVDIVVSDDGLQHYAMSRDIEVAVVDGKRRLGNGWMLPAGPLRESARRLITVDAVIVNGGRDEESAMQLFQSEAVNLADGSRLPLQAFTGQQGQAIAGIGNPERFFAQLRAAGIRIESHAFPDHHQYQLSDLDFVKDQWVLMTEKDAVKCQAFATEKFWYVPVEARFNSLAKAALDRIMLKLESLRNNDG